MLITELLVEIRYQPWEQKIDQRIFQVVRDLMRSLVEAPAQSRVRYEVQPGHRRVYPVWF